jgi:tetraprenyl-beta-curcumene synthase
MLKRWVATEYPGQQHTRWWELSGAASAPLAIHALLALAAEPACSPQQVTRTYLAYTPLSAATTMLDSYVDRQQDRETGDHSYIAHYPDEQDALAGVRTLVMTSLTGVCELPEGHRHAVIAASMIAMYLSKQTVPAPDLRAGTRTFLHAGGSLTRLLLPILRAWRIAYAQRTA